jgi:hypothetical protein
MELNPRLLLNPCWRRCGGCCNSLKPVSRFSRLLLVGSVCVPLAHEDMWVAGTHCNTAVHGSFSGRGLVRAYPLLHLHGSSFLKSSFILMS